MGREQGGNHTCVHYTWHCLESCLSGAIPKATHERTICIYGKCDFIDQSRGNTSVFLCVRLSISVYLHLSLSIFMPIYRSLSLFITIYLAIYLSIYLLICLSLLGNMYPVSDGQNRHSRTPTCRSKHIQ